MGTLVEFLTYNYVSTGCEAAERAASRRGERPANKLDRAHLLHDIKELETKHETFHHVTALHAFILCFTHPPSLARLDQLDLMAATDLELDRRHFGKVLVGRTLCTSAQPLAKWNALEDRDGNVEAMWLYDRERTCTGYVAIPKGIVVANKEPFYTVTPTGTYAIRIDHPTDLVILPSNNKFAPGVTDVPALDRLQLSTDVYKTKGNLAFKAGKYLEALDQYALGLKGCSEDEHLLRCDLYRNRSMISQKLGRYEAAIADAKAALLPSGNMREQDIAEDTKAWFKAARAAYDLTNFKQAGRYLDRALELSPGDSDAVREMQRIKARIQESQKGTYDFAEMHHKTLRSQFHIDCASSTSNVVVDAAGTRGRGLSVTKDLKAGDVIMCEKAFEMVFPADEDHYYGLVYNKAKDKSRYGVYASLLDRIYRHLRHNPSSTKAYMDLFDGGYSPKSQPQSVDGQHVVDYLHVAAILDNHSIDCTTEEGAGNASDSSNATIVREHGPVHPEDIWLEASYINHECDGNAYSISIGDVMIVTAVRDLARGEEVTQTYVPFTTERREASSYIRSYWKFECKCNICKVESMIPSAVVEQRELLGAQILSLKGRLPARSRALLDSLLREAKELCVQLEKTFDPVIYASRPRPGLAEIYNLLCILFDGKGDVRQTLHYACLHIEAAGFKLSTTRGTLEIDRSAAMMNAAIGHSAIAASRAHRHSGNATLAADFARFSRDLYRMC